MTNEPNEVYATNQLTIRREFVEQRGSRTQTTVTERKFTIKMCRQLKRSYHPCLSSLDFQPKFSNFHFKNETELKLLRNSVLILFFKYQFFFYSKCIKKYKNTKSNVKLGIKLDGY